MSPSDLSFFSQTSNAASTTPPTNADEVWVSAAHRGVINVVRSQFISVSEMSGRSLDRGRRSGHDDRLMVQPKYSNKLPDLPFAPKFLEFPFDPERYGSPQRHGMVVVYVMCMLVACFGERVRPCLHAFWGAWW